MKISKSVLIYNLLTVLIKVLGLSLIFIIGANMAFLAWIYLGLIIYPYWWLIWFSNQKVSWWLMGGFLSLIIDFSLAWPLGLSWLIINLLDLWLHWQKSYWLQSNLSNKIISFSILLVGYVLIFQYLLHLNIAQSLANISLLIIFIVYFVRKNDFQLYQN